MSSEAKVPATSRRRPSLADVAAHAGVSQGAVSKVIRNAYGVSASMQERVQRSIDDLGYRPRTGARGLRGQTFTIAIGLTIPQLSNEFFSQVASGAARKLAGSGYQLIIGTSLDHRDDQGVLDALIDRQVDGIIAISLDISAKWLERFARYAPTVLIGRHDQSQNYDTVTDDDLAGGYLAMDHLLGLGHERIAFLTVWGIADRPESRPPHALRQEAYEQRMASRALQPQFAYAISEQEAYEATRNLLDSATPPTAIFAGNDALAIGTLRAITERGLTPQDVSVVGYDNIGLAGHPLVSLTTIDQYGEQIGEAAVELLLERIEQTRTEPRHVQLDPQLVVRKSTSTPAPVG
ncbi:LacI family DNA-binding transcriptional regulator [Arthrobacter sp. D2-10]